MAAKYKKPPVFHTNDGTSYVRAADIFNSEAGQAQIKKALNSKLFKRLNEKKQKRQEESSLDE
ncbi:hypothetical protein E1H12_09105 [Geitlerinema sp. P-1104]|uniref:hypothetical protein n=1 Tax=Cyanophyceae TaxID=3028117 RepID=UPI0012256C65|nr:hypothetical protein [Geitlerinema sp. P-1104]NMG58674.1 hypothetical protein [Geitlerinema sp. P-1104]TAN97567.1 MAG: hypothetical protein EYR95_11800 [Phormidium sp. SL48-SHIP]